MRKWALIVCACASPLIAQMYDEARNFTKAGIVAHNLKKLAEARRLLSTALDYDSTWAPAVLHHGQAFADLLIAELYIRTTRRFIDFEKFTNAERELDEAESLYPEHPQIPELRALIRKKRDDNTKEILAKLPEAKKKEYEEAMKNATEAMDATKYAEALHHYSIALKIAPESLDAKMGYAEAERMLKGADGDQKVAALFRQAEKFEKERRFAQAIGAYDKVLRIEPNNTQAIERKAALLDFMQQQLNTNERGILAREYLQSGNEAFRKADYSLAVENYRVGQALNPKLTDWDSLIKKALAAKKKQDENLFTDRLQELERRYKSAMVQMLLENYPAAVEDLEVVITIAKEFKQEETQKHAEALLQRAKEAMLRQDEEFLTRDSPYYSFVQSLTSLGLASYKARDCETTLKHFGAIAEVFPKNRISNQHIISCTLILNPAQKDSTLKDIIETIYRVKDTNAFEAKRLFEILKFVDPENPAIPELERELSEKAQVLKRAVQPAEYLEALYRKALLLSQTDPESALAVLRDLLADDPQHVKARVLYARIEARISRQRWAESDTPIAPAAMQAYAAGIVYYNTGQLNEARTAFARAIELAPNFDRAQVALKKCEAYAKGAKF
ncbi:MAG: tetratricopeptide repeat protein [Spirochaetes bacterium]|nr:tetratricopeptide repeat protein [Spirochaetota bacterium]